MDRPCPHKNLKGDGVYWWCEWCSQPFIPATREAANKLIQDDEESKRFFADWAGTDKDLA